MQQNLGVNSYPGRPDSFPAEEGRQYTPTNAEAQWQWDRDAQRMSPQLYSDGISPFMIFDSIINFQFSVSYRIVS